MRRLHCLLFSVGSAVGLLLLAGCPRAVAPPTPPGHPPPYRIGSNWYQPIPHAGDFRQSGLASWYGKPFHGRKTANGETYNMYAMTAAHKTLPLGTYVRVRNRNSGKKVVVRINDRGPFVRSRIIDLSYTAAKKLGIVGPGTAPVEITALGKAPPSQSVAAGTKRFIPVDYDKGIFTFQVGAFKHRINAERLKADLDKRYRHVVVSTFDTGDEVFYRVRVGKYDSLEKITRDAPLLTQNGFKDAFIVAE